MTNSGLRGFSASGSGHDKQKIVVVLGMHRSGTSAVTRGLQALGVELGDRLMSPIEEDNLKGYWEDIDLTALNTEMLGAIGSDWHHMSAVDLKDIEVLREKGYFLRATELLLRKAGGAPVFGFKDPRTAKLLLFWKEVFSRCQFEVYYVIAVRHPLSVARSLVKRDGFETEQSCLLWLSYVLSSLTGSAGDKRVIVDYDRLLEDPERELLRIGKCAGLNIDPAKVRDYQSEFLDRGLRHTVYGLNEFLTEDGCPPIVREVYTALLEAASDGKNLEAPELHNELAVWAAEFARLKPLLRLVDRLFAQKSLAVQTAADCDRQIAVLYGSNSWRLTKPLRSLSRLLAGALKRAGF